MTRRSDSFPIESDVDKMMKIFVYFCSEDFRTYSVYEAYIKRNDFLRCQREIEINPCKMVIPSFIKKTKGANTYTSPTYLCALEGKFPNNGITKRKMWLFNRNDELAEEIIRKYRYNLIDIYRKRAKDYQKKADYCRNQIEMLKKVENLKPIFEDLPSPRK